MHPNALVNWLIGFLVVVLLFGFILFGGVGGMTAVFMVVALVAGVVLFRQFARQRRTRL